MYNFIIVIVIVIPQKFSQKVNYLLNILYLIANKMKIYLSKNGWIGERREKNKLVPLNNIIWHYKIWSYTTIIFFKYFTT